MRLVDLKYVSYIGGDIVEPLVRSLNEKFAGPNISFINIDLVKDSYTKTDLMLNRDCLFHLSYNDILGVLGNFLDSESSFLLTTSHKNCGDFENKDIESGDFRLIDLLSYPFNFPDSFLFRIDESSEGTMPPRMLLLYRREQVNLVVLNLKHHLN